MGDRRSEMETEIGDRGGMGETRVAGEAGRVFRGRGSSG